VERKNDRDKLTKEKKKGKRKMSLERGKGESSPYGGLETKGRFGLVFNGGGRGRGALGKD